jgi:hypothetical protein
MKTLEFYEVIVGQKLLHLGISRDLKVEIL